jgi:hypothetical protein
MPCLVCAGATLRCTFGSAPSALLVPPVNGILAKPPAANILDFVPGKNILPFVTCSSPANPAVIAALGVPVPCTPLTVAPWMPGAVMSMVGGVPALSDTSMTMCAYAGVIQIQAAGQVNTDAK